MLGVHPVPGSEQALSNTKKVKRRQPDKDSALPFLDVQQASRVRALMRETLAERGLEVTTFKDHLRTADGREFGLWNVAANCLASGRTESMWRRVVSDHVDKLLAGVAGGDPFEGLTTQEEVMSRTYTRLWEASSLPGGAEHYPHVEFVPGILEVITLRLPNGVATFNRDRVEEFGGWELLRAQGRSNLPSKTPDHVEAVVTREGASFFIACGDSTFTASQALLMPGFAQIASGPVDTSNGWFLSVPNRHEVCWHIIADPEDAVSAFVAMTVYTPQANAATAGPLSPHVFWWSGDSYRQVTTRVEDGRITCVLDKQLTRALDGLLSSR